MESKLSSTNYWPCGLLAIHLTSLSISSLIYRVSLTAWKDWYKCLCSGQAFITGSFSFHFPPLLGTLDPSMGKDPCRPLSANLCLLQDPADVPPLPWSLPWSPNWKADFLQECLMLVLWCCFFFLSFSLLSFSMFTATSDIIQRYIKKKKINIPPSPFLPPPYWNSQW